MNFTKKQNKNSLESLQEELTFGIQATWQGGTADTLGESRWFSESRDPSKLQPSSCRPPTFTWVLAPCTPPLQLTANFRLSMEHPTSLQKKMAKTCFVSN